MIDFLVTEALVHRGREAQEDAQEKSEEKAKAKQFRDSHKDFNPPDTPAPAGG